MKMEKSSEFDQVRSAARYIEESMDIVDIVLSNPLRVFDVSKTVEAENIIIGDKETCKELIAEVADFRCQLDHNLKGTSEFLEQASNFSANVSAALDQFETHLAQFGFKKPQDSIAEDDDSSTETSNTPATTNGKSAIDIDTSGIQEFEESPQTSTGTAKLHRKLSFDH